jgi:hypothetical protein
MAESAFQKQYRQEFVAGFEQGMSMLRSTTVTEAVTKGNEAVFLVADTGDAEAVTRGLNGLIPPRPDNLNQLTATLQEWHDKPRRTKFNIFASQGDGRRIMQQGTIKVINRKIDQDIIAALATATNDTGSAVTASVALIAKAVAILGNNEVDIEEEDNMFGVITPAMLAYLMQTTEFASSDYVDVKPFAGPIRKYRRWFGINWIVHPRLPGSGTAAETAFIYHRNAIGHAVNTGEMEVKAGENEEDSYFWARASIFMGSKLLQNSGVVVVNHNGAEFVAS